MLPRSSNERADDDARARVSPQENFKNAPAFSTTSPTVRFLALHCGAEDREGGHENAETAASTRSFYRRQPLAQQPRSKTLAYVALLNPESERQLRFLAAAARRSRLAGYGAQIARVNMPGAGDELHHFGWNACSSCLCPNSPHPHMQRRYLVVPGMRSSRIHILDTVPDARQPRIIKVIEAEELFRKTGYSRPYTAAPRARRYLHQRAGRRRGRRPWRHLRDGPEAFEIKGRWEKDRGPQRRPPMIFLPPLLKGFGAVPPLVTDLPSRSTIDSSTSRAGARAS